MKKLFSLVSVLLVVFTLSACKSEDVTNPKIKGANDVTLELNAAFDPKAGVTATDDHDGNITSKIEVFGIVDTAKEGDYLLRYKVVDKAGNKANVLRKITVVYNCTPAEGELYCNGDFIAGASGWDTYIHDNGAAGEFSVEDGVGKFTITTVPDSSMYWSHQLIKKNLTIVENKSYLVTFKAKADAARKISAVVEDPNDNAGGSYYQYGKYQVYNITTEWQDFELYFDTLKGTETAQLGLFFGKVAGDVSLTTVYLDDVIIKEVTPRPDETKPEISGAVDSVIEVGTTFDPLAGVTASDNKDGDITSSIAVTGDTVDTNTTGTYTVTYTVTDAAGNVATTNRVITVVELVFNDTDKIANGDFANPLNAETPEWGKVANDGAAFTYSVVNGELVVDLQTSGANPWSSQLVYGGVTLEKGKTYKIVFKSKADTARSINVSGGETLPADPWWNGFFATSVDLTTEYQTFEYMFTMTQNTFDNTDVKFEFGTGDANKLYFDDIIIKELDESSVISNGNLDVIGFTSWWGDEWAGYGSGSIAVENGILVVDVQSIGGAPHAPQVYQDNLTIEKDKSYKIEFKVKSDIARPFNVQLGEPLTYDPWFTAFMPAYKVNATTEWQTISIPFTMDLDTNSNGKLVFELGKIDELANLAHKIYFDDIKILEQDANDTTVYNDTTIITNGTFDQALDFTSWWGDEWAGYATGAVTVVDGVLVADLQAVGNAAHSPQVYQDGLTIKGNRTYTIEFDVKADVARPINVQIGESLTSDPWFNAFMDAELVDVTTEWQHITISFDMTQATNENGKLVFELGQITDESGTALVSGANKVYIDNVIIYPNFN